MPEENKSSDNRQVTSTNRQISDDLNVGSKKWHFAIADELDEQSKSEPDKEQAKYIRERAEFHRLVGQHQK